ncbi:MAG: hypothetical protein AMS20_00040 [Gemmatimonas sp. SG8_28]|nr:MAG: hypothetical protein AMS20_00040 [Gemmatimonas sp. SG8_28]
MTTVENIIDATIERLLVFDLGRSDLAQNDQEFYRILNRYVPRLYAEAAQPVAQPNVERNDYFEVTELLTLVGLEDTLGQPYAWPPSFVASYDGSRIALTTKSALARGRGELPPAVYLQGLVVTSGGRTGDPTDGDTFYARYTPVTNALSDRTHYIGATTPGTEATSKWPAHIGDEALVAMCAHYFALKSGDVPADELQKLAQEADTARGLFLAYVRSVH